ncbi:MAG: hypothetical protein JWO40_500 [Candidatus Doudnabacteria bacterium]|nr:hypothetical protein [Candidatus Doudnabacteria bacterium]
MPKRTFKQYKVILAIALVLLTTRIGLNTLYTGDLTIIAGASDITVANVTNAVNNERTQRNLIPLNYNAKLAAAADYKAKDMIARKYFSHTDPEGHYIWDKIVAEGYTPYTVLGENLAIDFSDTAGLVAAWIDSPTHRANLLNTSFEDEGMGVAMGDTNNGEYSVAVANTFGTQPKKSTPKAPTQTTATPPPTKPSTVTNKPVIKNPTPSPIPTTPSNVPAKTNTAPSVNIVINNTDNTVHKNSITLTGSTTPNSTIKITDSASSATPVTAQSDTNGNFIYTFRALNNGTHTFVATINTAKSNAYKVDIAYNPPQIAEQSIQVTPQVQNNQLNIQFSVAVTGAPQTVSASLLGQNINLVSNNNKYVGGLILGEYTNYQNSTVLITAEDQYGNKSNLSIALKDYPLSTAEDPKTLGHIVAKAQSPDLYNTFKYIVLVAGAMFLLFLLGDTLHLSKKKYREDLTRGSNIIVLMLVLSTLLLVTWWH